MAKTLAERYNSEAERLNSGDTGMNQDRSKDAIVMAKLRQVFAAESQYGHSDAADFLCSYLDGTDSLDMFLWNCDVTYLGSDAEPPAA